MTDISYLVADRIIELCKSKSITPNKLANWSGVPQSTIKSILSKRESQNPKIKTIYMICSALGMTLSDFFNTEEFSDFEMN